MDRYSGRDRFPAGISRQDDDDHDGPIEWIASHVNVVARSRISGAKARCVFFRAFVAICNEKNFSASGRESVGGSGAADGGMRRT